LGSFNFVKSTKQGTQCQFLSTEDTIKEAAVIARIPRLRTIQSKNPLATKQKKHIHLGW